MRSEGYSSCQCSSVCLSVCLSVCPLVGNSLLKRVFVLKMLAHNQRATKVKIFVGICLKRLRSRVIPRNMSEKANMLITRGQFSPLNTQRSVNGYPTIVNNIQPCQKRCLLMPLTRVRARTDSTTHHSYNAIREAWSISAHAHWYNTQDSTQDMQYAPRVCTLVLSVCTRDHRQFNIFSTLVTP